MLEEFKIYSVETVSEVSHKSNVKIVIKRKSELKKHNRTTPDAKFKKFSLTKQKLDLQRTMNEMGKSSPNKSGQKIFKKTDNQCRNAAYEQKTTSEKENLVQTKD